MQSKSIVLIISAALACCFGVVAAHGAQEFGDGGDAAFEAAARLRGAHAEPPMRAATPQYSENQPAGATFKQDRLAIGFWVDPPADGAPGEVDRLYAQVADANFTFVLGGFGDTTPESAAAQIAACKAHDLRVVVHASDASSTASLPWEDGTSWGYQLKDEPLPPAFPGLAALAENVTRLRPGALPFINLLPDYGPFPNKTAYLQYVEEFVATVPTPVLSFDSYPLYQRSFDQATGTVQVQDTRADYLFNLRAFRTAAEKHGLVFWNFFNTMPYGSHADPSEDLVRWQAMAAVLHGAKGVMYFCYWSPVGGTFALGNAIIRPTGTNTSTASFSPGPHYAQAKRTNSILVAWEPVLLHATSTGVWQVQPGENTTAALAGSVIESLEPSLATWVSDFSVGQFRVADGRVAVMVLSNAIGFSSIPTVVLRGIDDPAAAGVVEVDPSTGAEVVVADEAPGHPGFQQVIGSAQARLYILPATTATGAAL